jgi:hypothetical protein
MALFFDTSALAKLYHEEVGSVFVQQLFEVPEQVSFISRLCAIEMHSVLAGKVRIGEITAEAMELARRRFRADARTLDALQLAMAIDLQRNRLVGSFVAADRILGRIAPLEGIEVMNPEAPEGRSPYRSALRRSSVYPPISTAGSVGW